MSHSKRTTASESWVSRGMVARRIDENVYEAALRRIEDLYNRVDEVVVSFSGGKDSTCVMMVTLEVAKKLGRLPLKVLFFDEEIVDPDTIEYIERVRLRDEIDLYWFCVPVAHTLRSTRRTF